MSHVTGLFIIDAPASALNNAGEDKEEKRAGRENAVAVKFISAPNGLRYPYVSAQGIRYWLRTQLEENFGWKSSRVFRETSIAYAEGDPASYPDDDLFGYMRAPTLEGDKKAVEAGMMPLDKEKRDGKQQPVPITRVSPLRIGTAVATVANRPTGDFGQMSRSFDDKSVKHDPVLHHHQFYRAHLKAPFAIDLTLVGTFFDRKKVGYRNLSASAKKTAEEAGATQVEVRGQPVLRLPLAARKERVATLLRALGRLEGGAKQTLHLTDTSPSILLLAVLKHGNQPFLRVLGDSPTGATELKTDVLAEALRVFKDDLLSPLYIGWARGFLDEERAKLEAFANPDTKKEKPDPDRRNGVTIHIKHPREIAEDFADAVMKNDRWFD